jgi:hypothetical protein
MKVRGSAGEGEICSNLVIDADSRKRRVRVRSGTGAGATRDLHLVLGILSFAESSS